MHFCRPVKMGQSVITAQTCARIADEGRTSADFYLLCLRRFEQGAHARLQARPLHGLAAGLQVGEVHGAEALPEPTSEALDGVEVWRARRYVPQLHLRLQVSGFGELRLQERLVVT